MRRTIAALGALVVVLSALVVLATPSEARSRVWTQTRHHAHHSWVKTRTCWRQDTGYRVGTVTCTRWSKWRRR